MKPHALGARCQCSTGCQKYSSYGVTFLRFGCVSSPLALRLQQHTQPLPLTTTTAPTTATTQRNNNLQTSFRPPQTSFRPAEIFSHARDLPGLLDAMPSPEPKSPEPGSGATMTAWQEHVTGTTWYNRRDTVEGFVVLGSDSSFSWHSMDVFNGSQNICLM